MLQKVISNNLFFIKRNPGTPVSMQVFVRNWKHLPSRKSVGLLDSGRDLYRVNHLYWCVASSPSGDGEMVKAKWLSLDHHPSSLPPSSLNVPSIETRNRPPTHLLETTYTHLRMYQRPQLPTGDHIHPLETTSTHLRPHPPTRDHIHPLETTSTHWRPHPPVRMHLKLYNFHRTNTLWVQKLSGSTYIHVAST